MTGERRVKIMMIKERYEAAKEAYRAIGVDTDAALEALAKIPVSMHCWQGDDVAGFDNPGQLSGGTRQLAIIREKPEIQKS